MFEIEKNRNWMREMGNWERERGRERERPFETFMNGDREIKWEI
jgi:hypothetical protein